MKNKPLQRDLRAGLRASGFLWLFFLSFSALFLWIFHDEAGTPIVYAQVAFGAGVGMLCIASISSFVVPPQLSRVQIAYWIGGIGFASLLFITFFFSLSYFFIGVHSVVGRFVALATIALGALIWCWRSIAELKQRIQTSRFLEKEFRIEETQIVMRTPPKTNLDSRMIKTGSWLDKAGGWLFSKLVLLIPMAYPLQRLFSDTGGLPAVLLLLSVLTLPLAIYILGRMACGYYLGIHTIRKLERQHGKPVVFEQSEGA